MSGPKRNPDKLNTIGVVVVGICGAVLVYVTIVALQAFYVNDTSEIQTMADYGGQDKTAKGHRADETRNITEAGKNAASPGQEATFRIPIDTAMKLVVDDAKKDPSHLVPALPPSTKPSIDPVFGRPKAAPPAGGAAPGGAAPGAAAPGAAAPAGAAPEASNPPAAPMSPTGQPGEPQPVAGAGGVPSGGTATGNPQTGSAAVTPGAAKGVQTQPKTTTPKTAPQPKATTPAQPKTTTPAQPKATTPPAQPKATGSATPKTP
jgi:hypothetical protein